MKQQPVFCHLFILPRPMLFSFVLSCRKGHFEPAASPLTQPPHYFMHMSRSRQIRIQKVALLLVLLESLDLCFTLRLDLSHLQYVAVCCCMLQFVVQDSARSLRSQNSSNPCHNGCVVACCSIRLRASNVISPGRVNTILQTCIKNSSLPRGTLFSLRSPESSHSCLSFSCPSK